jgi:hypothetical protein
MTDGTLNDEHGPATERPPAAVVTDTLALLDGLRQRGLQATQVEVYSGRVSLSGLVPLPPEPDDEITERPRRRPRA